MPPSLPLQPSSNGSSLRRTKKNTKKKVQVVRKSLQGKDAKQQETKVPSNRDSADEFGTGPLTAASDAFASQNNILQSQMPPMYGGSPMYGGYGGMSSMMGGMSPMMMPGSPFSGLYQVLFGVQNVVFSLGQAVQVLGTNQQAIQQAFESLISMIDNSVATFHELRAIEAVQIKNESEEQKSRRRRLKALRWAILMGGSWLVYKLLHRIIRGRRRRLTNNGANAFSSSLDYPRTGYGHSNGGFGSMQGSNMYGGYSPGGASMFGGGGLYGSGGSGSFY
jgi:hypothetical protein